MVKSLSHKSRSIWVVVQCKWKSWNIIAIQMDSGESRTSEDAGALEFNSSPADAFRSRRVNFNYVLVVKYVIRTHPLARELAGRTPNS